MHTPTNHRTISFPLIALLAVLLCLPGCKNLGAAFPRTYDLPHAYPDDAPEPWKKGWEQGCKSGLSVYGNYWYKTWYSYEQDITLINDPYYSKAWLDSFNYCRGYINRILSGENAGGEKHGGVFSTSTLNFGSPSGDLRGESLVSKRYGMEFDIYSGVDAPGWGSGAWGANVPCQGDWLGRKPANCSWMGYK